MVRATPSDFEHWLRITSPAAYSPKLLCEALQVSPRQLHRYTLQFYGLTPQRWLDSQRIARSLPMLMESRSVKIVAGDLGFKQASHFSRIFKIFSGIPPKAFLQGLHRTS